LPRSHAAVNASAAISAFRRRDGRRATHRPVQKPDRSKWVTRDSPGSSLTSRLWHAL
jgi:hypothetical protein